MAPDRSTLLLADDDPTIADSLAPFLERAGFHVLVVSDGMSALEKAQAHHPELIILDVLMPRMDGREVLRRLRRSRIWTPTILLTQVGEASERALALEEGADDYLNKPFDPHELLARIRAVLRRARPGERSLSAAWLLTANDLSLDRRARRATLSGETLDLTPKALAVLEYLMTHPDEAITRERLLEAVRAGSILPAPALWTHAWRNCAASWMMTRRSRASSKPFRAKAIASLHMLRRRDKIGICQGNGGSTSCYFHCRQGSV